MNPIQARSSTEIAAPYVCQSCGQAHESKFCPACGEKKIDRHDFALKHFVEETFEGLTHFDNKFFKTVKALVTQPGQLSVYFAKGRRVQYLKPFQLFIICNLLFFLLVGKMNTFSISLSGFYFYEPYTFFGTQETVKHLANTDSEYANLVTRFDEQMSHQSKTFILFFIPVFGLFFTLMFYRTKKYLSEHLVFATHFFSFVLLFCTVTSLFITKPFYYFTHSNYVSAYDAASTLISLLCYALYFAFAAKRFYGIKNITAIAGALGVALIYVVALTLYRVLLFYYIIGNLHT
jgi:hypothetical protein